MTRKRKALLILLTLLIVATVAFIWSNSMESREVSAEKSNSVLDWIRPFLALFVGKENVTDHLVRKLAHFTEYGVLGGLLAAWLLTKNSWKWRSVGICLLLGLCVAAADETIQIFFKRGAQVRDVLLDFCGVCCGVGGVWLLVLLAETIRRKDD